MDDELEKIESANILRAIPHESTLPGVPEGHYTLRHEIVGTIDRGALMRLIEESGYSAEGRGAAILRLSLPLRRPTPRRRTGCALFR